MEIGIIVQFTQLNAQVRVLDPLVPLFSLQNGSAPNEPISGFSGFGGLGKMEGFAIACPEPVEGPIGRRWPLPVGMAGL